MVVVSSDAAGPRVDKTNGSVPTATKQEKEEPQLVPEKTEVTMLTKKDDSEKNAVQLSKTAADAAKEERKRRSRAVLALKAAQANPPPPKGAANPTGKLNEVSAKGSSRPNPSALPPRTTGLKTHKHYPVAARRRGSGKKHTPPPLLGKNRTMQELAELRTKKLTSFIHKQFHTMEERNAAIKAAEEAILAQLETKHQQSKQHKGAGGATLGVLDEMYLEQYHLKKEDLKKVRQAKENLERHKYFEEVRSPDSSAKRVISQHPSGSTFDEDGLSTMPRIDPTELASQQNVQKVVNKFTSDVRVPDVVKEIDNRAKFKVEEEPKQKSVGKLTLPTLKNESTPSTLPQAPSTPTPTHTNVTELLKDRARWSPAHSADHAAGYGNSGRDDDAQEDPEPDSQEAPGKLSKDVYNPFKSDQSGFTKDSESDTQPCSSGDEAGVTREPRLGRTSSFTGSEEMDEDFLVDDVYENSGGKDSATVGTELSSLEVAVKRAEELARQMANEVDWWGTASGESADEDTFDLESVTSMGSKRSVGSKMSISGISAISNRTDDDQWYTYWSDEHQREYYYNPHTNSVVWTIPNDGDEAEDDEDDADIASASVALLSALDDTEADYVSVMDFTANNATRDNVATSNDPDYVPVMDFTNNSYEKNTTYERIPEGTDPSDYVPVMDFTSTKASLSRDESTVASDTDSVRVMDFTKKPRNSANLSTSMTMDNYSKMQIYARMRRKRRRRRLAVAVLAVILGCSAVGFAYSRWGKNVSNMEEKIERQPQEIKRHEPESGLSKTGKLGSSASVASVPSKNTGPKHSAKQQKPKFVKAAKRKDRIIKKSTSAKMSSPNSEKRPHKPVSLPALKPGTETKRLDLSSKPDEEKQGDVPTTPVKETEVAREEAEPVLQVFSKLVDDSTNEVNEQAAKKSFYGFAKSFFTRNEAVPQEIRRTKFCKVPLAHLVSKKCRNEFSVAPLFEELDVLLLGIE